MDQDAARREVARIMLGALQDTDFVLTGASALAEHGIITRPTRDVDLFTVGDEGQRVPDALPALRAALEEHGATLTTRREFPGFVDGRVTYGGFEVGFDLGADWRAYPPVTMDIGPVLDLRDSVASKTAALYSRYETRDFIDGAAIVLDGRWSPEDIMTMGAQNDPGFDRTEFARILDPANPKFPESEDFREMGLDHAAEVRMRDALTVLRHAAQGNDVDVPEMLEYLEAVRAAAGGRAQPVTEQLQTDRRADGPSRALPRREHTQEHDVER